MVAPSNQVCANSYIESLRGNESADWLVIAHNDPIMLRRLERATHGQSAAVLTTPKRAWQDERQPLLGAVAWALAETDVRKLVLAGSSNNLLIPDRMHRANSGYQTTLATASGKPSPLDLVRQAEFKRQQDQEDFVEQVAELLNSPAVSQRLIAGDLSFQGLYYRAESGLFTVLDPGTRTLTPIAA